MFYSEQCTIVAAKKPLKERRVKITVEQDNRLTELEEKINVPASVLVRMALDSFLPKIANSGFTEKGIKTGYLNGNY
jgi:hypothetical protein